MGRAVAAVSSSHQRASIAALAQFSLVWSVFYSGGHGKANNCLIIVHANHTKLNPPHVCDYLHLVRLQPFFSLAAYVHGGLRSTISNELYMKPITHPLQCCVSKKSQEAAMTTADSQQFRYATRLNRGGQAEQSSQCSLLRLSTNTTIYG
jgi:hypothetical protein